MLRPHAHLPDPILARISAFEQGVVPAGRSSLAGLFFGEIRVRRELSLLRHEIEGTVASPQLLHDVVEVIAERATLLRRAAYLGMTKSLFTIWHVFHMPLVYVMFGIVVLHVAFTLYLGYLPFGY